MAIAQGSCPSCGAPIEYGLGASLSRVCNSCHATVVRTDRGLQDFGKVAALADTPSIISVGDQGTLDGRPFEVLGRVQLDYGLGPWDEFYVAFDYGREWGWLAYAQGRWYLTFLVVGLSAPQREALRVDEDVELPMGRFAVAEARNARVLSAEGELPDAITPGELRVYADAYGPQNAFATLDYGDGKEASCVFVGKVLPDSQLNVTAPGPRTVRKIKTTHMQCPNCGGDVPKLHEGRSERLGCPFCGAVSDIQSRNVVARQEKLLQMPDIPIGTSGVFDSDPYLCIAYLQRSTIVEGERYGWEEYLLFNADRGYRWLVKDPETGWSWVSFLSPAEIDRRSLPNTLRYANKTFAWSTGSGARVDYVLGEVYWKCSVGETVTVADFTCGGEVISREQDNNEVNYSYGRRIRWSKIATAFQLPLDSGGGNGIAQGSGSGASAGCGTIIGVIVLVVILIIVLAVAAASEGGSGGSGVFIGGGSSYRGGGSYSGGK
jgi:hypothetical protein